MAQKKSFAQNIKEETGTVLERAKAKTQGAKGLVKETIGKVTDNTKLKAEGKIDQAAGKAKDAAAKVKDAARDAGEKINKEMHKKH